MPDELDDLDILNDVGDPDNPGDQGTGDSKDDDVDDDDGVDDKDDDGDEDDTDDESDDKEDEEGDDEGDKDEDKEDEGDKDEKKGKILVEGRPTYQELKKADPDIFKKVPGLKDIFFREQKFSETFASVEEAQAAAVKAENYDIVEATLVNGDPSLILAEIGKNSPESLPVLVDNFLPTLQKLSKDLYVRATMPVLEDLIRLAYNDGKRTNNKNLMHAAGHLAMHVFGEPRIPEPRNTRTEPHPAEVQLRTERERHFNERYSSFNTEVTTEAYTRMERFAEKGINDPEGKLSGFTKKAIVKEALAELDRRLGEDQQLSQTLRQLWKRATVGGFTKEHKEAILNAHLSRAKQLLPGIRNRMVAEALGEKVSDGKKVKTKKRDLPDGGRAGGLRPGQKMDPKKIDWRKTSDSDILNDRVTFRK